MRGVIKKKHKDKLSTLVLLSGKQLSQTELSLLTEIIYFSSNGTVTMDVHLTKQIREKIGIKESAFNTSISRLQKKKCIRKDSKVVYIAPNYLNLDNITEVLIKFE